jgi:hypothetical protein
MIRVMPYRISGDGSVAPTRASIKGLGESEKKKVSIAKFSPNEMFCALPVRSNPPE